MKHSTRLLLMQQMIPVRSSHCIPAHMTCDDRLVRPFIQNCVEVCPMEASWPVAGRFCMAPKQYLSWSACMLLLLHSLC